MTTPSTPSILRSLRQLTPRRACSFTEALNLAERQAAKLCTLLAATHPSYQLTGITEDHLAQLPRIRIVREQLPVSGMSHWNGKEWIICLGSGDPEVRQRFTMLHEFKHIIDHGHTHWLYTEQQPVTTRRHWSGSPPLSAHEQAERAADYFAVSEAAIHVRIDQTDIARALDPEPLPARCARPIHTQRWQPQRFTIQQPHYGRR